jgi:DNA-binding CsgD family transcriptional regulator/PAS domain-containing protein
VVDSVDRVRTAGLAAVAVTGEAGIGKSRLLTEAVQQLSGSGWQLLRVHADRLERRVLYAALVTGLRQVAVENIYTDGLRREAVTALDLGEPESTGPPGTVFGRACAVVTRLFTALSAARPLAIVVDDLHELDDESLALLTVVLRRLSAAPIGLLVALRAHLATPNPAAEEMLGRLESDIELVRVELGTLPPDDLAAMITAVLGAPPDADLTAEVHRRADGNPFFATEIARSLANAGLVALDTGSARLTVEPHTVRLTRGNAVLQRVLPLSADARAVARTLAVLRVIDLDRMGLVARVAGVAEPAVAAAFDDLVRANVVAAEPNGRYRFAHDIVADALYDEIGPAQARQLHGVVAAQLLAARNRGEDVGVLDLARHVSESAVPGDSAAVGVLAEAARHTLTDAPDAAAGFCADALGLLPPDATGRAGLLGLRARALARASRPAQVVPPGLAALALLPPGDDRSRTATAVVSSLFLLGRLHEAIAVVDGQIAAGPGTAALHAQRAVLLAFAGRHADALAAADVAAAVPPASPAEEVVVCGQLAMLTSMTARHAQTLEYIDRALRSAGDSTTLQLQALAVGASTGALAGLVDDASWRLRRAERLAGEAGSPYAFSSELSLARVVLDWLGGRWDAALDCLRTLRPELETREQATLGAALTAVELEIRTWRGELVPAGRLAERAAPAARNMSELHAHAVAGYLAACGDVEGARRTLRGALDDPRTAPYGILLLARLLDLDGNSPGETATLLDTLIDIARGQVSPWSKTTLHRTVGIVRRDRESLALAVREAAAGGLVFERARAQLVLGELAADAGDELVEAYRTFARLGAHGLRRRAGRRLHGLGEKVPRSRSRAAAGLLTESEERVARLVQQGMRNREIAAALHYSPRSVEVYLSRIYGKLRVSSRLELARALDAIDASA